MHQTDAVTSNSESVEAAATRLRRAAESGVPCEPVRDLLGADEIELAYQVQTSIVRRRVANGAQIVGRKVGLTSPAVQLQLGVDQPDFGVLFADMRCRDGGAVPMSRLLQPKVEAEIAFVLGADLDAEVLDVGVVRAAVAYAVAALEIVDSRVRDWNIKIADTVADNASSGLFVLGTREVKIDDFAPVDVVMELKHNGAVESTGTGAACLGDPLNALLWLARTAQRYGSPLRNGDIVLSGALGPMIPVSAGSEVVATISELGRVSATFI